MLKEEAGSRTRARRDTGRGISMRLRTRGRGQKAQANVKIGDALFAFSWCFFGGMYVGIGVGLGHCVIDVLCSLC
jgi:hypothetical protein